MMTTRKISLSFFAASILGLTSSALAQYDYPTDPVAGSTASERGQIYGGFVTKIDAKNRIMTFKSKEGELDIVAGPQVKSFAKIKVGDRLDVQYTLAVIIELVKMKGNDVRGREVKSDNQTSKVGEKPATVRADIVKTTASVVAVNPKKQILTLKGPKGNVVEVKVEDPALLKGIAPKDHVFVTYTEAVAIAVSSPKQ
jgi:hypothetical protein